MEIKTISILSGCLLIIGFIGSVLIGEWVERRLRHHKWINGFVIRSATDESGIFTRLEGTVLKCYSSKRINVKTCHDIFRDCDSIQSIRFGLLDECFDIQLHPQYNLQDIYRKILLLNNTLNEHGDIKIWKTAKELL